MGGKTKKVDILDFLRASVTVNSKAYKKHVRAKRGTYTAISLPAVLKTNSDSQKSINRKSKFVFDKIKEMSPHFKDGKLWPRLLSVVRKNSSADAGHGYLGLDGFEVRGDYPSVRLLKLEVNFENDEPYFRFGVLGAYEIAIHLCVLEFDDDFEQVLGCYEWEFAVAGFGRFDFEGIEGFRFRGLGEMEYGADEGLGIAVGDGGLEADGSGVSSEGPGIDAGGAASEFGCLIKEFVYDPEKKGRYIGIFSFNKVEDGELRNVLANQGMKLIGF